MERVCCTRRAVRLLAWMMVALLARPWAAAQEFGHSEYEVKGAFLFHFVKFMEWPEESFRGTDGRIRLCVLGEDPFGPALDRLVQQKVVQGRALVVERMPTTVSVRHCQLVFISGSESRSLPMILAGLRGASVVTVGETGDFIRRGGMIRFLLQDDRVRFEINVELAEQAQVKISSKLLALAQVASPGGR